MATLSAAANRNGFPESATADTRSVRERMVQRLAQAGVGSPEVLAAMGAVERHCFVDSALANRAYEDTSLPDAIKR